MKTISKKIIAVAVVKDDKHFVGMNESIERPTELSGTTYKIVTPLAEQSLYMVINDIVLNAGTPQEQKRPFEIFIHTAAVESQQWVSALTLMISAVMRKGGDLSFIPRKLKSIHDPRGGVLKPGGVYVASLMAEIGLVIEQHFAKLGILSKNELSPEVKAVLAEKRAAAGDAMSNAGYCPACNAKAFVIMSGCGTCVDCGYSKCN